MRCRNKPFQFMWLASYEWSVRRWAEVFVKVVVLWNRQLMQWTGFRTSKVVICPASVPAHCSKEHRTLYTPMTMRQNFQVGGWLLRFFLLVRLRDAWQFLSAENDPLSFDEPRTWTCSGSCVVVAGNRVPTWHVPDTVY